MSGVACRVLLATAALLILSAPPAFAQIERYAVIVGNNTGADGEVALRYAEDDATKLSAVLMDLGGFSAENVVVLRGSDASGVRRALIDINDRIRARTSPQDSMLFVFFSGHADAVALHVGRSRLDLTELEKLVRGSAAGFRLLVLDACRSGALTRVKGGKQVPPFRFHVEERLQGVGAVFLTSSSSNEAAQESDTLRGSFFTHYLVSGLLGPADVDVDGRVVLDEAYQYAYENTLRASSRTDAGLQHPTFQYELRGQGDIVLTNLSTPEHGRGALVFPGGRAYLLMSGGPDGPVVAEVQPRDRSRRLSVKPGNYFVRGRGTRFLLEGRVTVTGGKELLVKDDTLERVEYARLVRKGGTNLRASHAVFAGLQTRTPLWTDTSMCHGGFAGYGVDLRRVSVSARLQFCQGSYASRSAELVEGNTGELGADVRLATAWDRHPVTIELAISTGAGVLHQTFTSEGLGPSPPRTSAVGVLGVGAALSLELRRGYYLRADTMGQTLFFRQQSAREEMTARFVLRTSVGVGKRF